MYPYTGRYPSHRRIALWLGMALCVIALVGASFTTDVGFLFLILLVQESLTCYV